MVSTPDRRVLVSGAGIAGPSLAWFLAKTGANITVLEKAPTLLPYGQNIDIKSGSALKVLIKIAFTRRGPENSIRPRRGRNSLTQTDRPSPRFR